MEGSNVPPLTCGDRLWRFVMSLNLNLSTNCLSVPGGGLGIFTDRNQRSIFLGFEFRESVFLGVLVTAAVSFWVVK